MKFTSYFVGIKQMSKITLDIFMNYPFSACRFIFWTLLASLVEVILAESMYTVMTTIIKSDEIGILTGIFQKLFFYLKIEHNLVNALSIFIAVSLLAVAFNILVEMDKGMMMKKIENNIRLALIKKFLSSKWSILSRINHGNFVNLIISDNKLYISVLRYIFLIVGNLIQIFIFILCVLKINLAFGILSYAMLAVCAFLMLPFMKYANRCGLEATNMNTSANSELINMLRALKDIKANSAENYVFSKMKHVMTGLTQVYFKVFVLVPTFQSQIHRLLAYFAYAISLYAGFQLFNMSMAVFSISAIFIYRSIPIFSLTSDYFTRASSHLASVNRIHEFDKSLIPSDRGLYKLDEPLQKIEFRSVSFGHKQNEKIFNNLNVVFKSGEFWAIMGESGVGKTTLIDLVCGLFRPESGSILYNDISSNDINLESLHNKIGYLSQTPFIFQGTIKENITWGNDDSNINQRMDGAVRISQLCGISNERGMNHYLDEMGNNLSGGQRQRIALARLMLKDYDFIMLDEPTSSLDPETEKSFIAELSSLKGKKGVIVVTHRDEYLKYADHLLTIKPNGNYEIAEQLGGKTNLEKIISSNRKI